jgi:indole-3-glycerol phosphate synthase
MDKLTEIMNWKRKEIAPRIRPVRDEELIRLAEKFPFRGAFRGALSSADELSVIAEIKRRSPSAGEIADIPDAPDQARKYVNAEVDCLSILTDQKYFGGHLDDLSDVTDFLRERNRPLPCLRKDFMVHPIQVSEAAEGGARAILIIVRALSDDEMKALRESADLAGLDCLYEVHEESELDRVLPHNPEIIGVNNRDLTRFVTDLSISEELIPQIPDNIVKVSESGILEPEDAWRVRDAGADAILCGEALMKAEDPEGFVAEMKDE